jgi:hypothetical protein
MIQTTLTDDERLIYERKLQGLQECINRLVEEKKSLILKVDALEVMMGRLKDKHYEVRK